MIVANLNEFYSGDFGVSKKTFNTAKKIFRTLVKKHGVPENQIEINEDRTVHYHLIGDDEKMMHFEISVQDDGMIQYWCETVYGKGYMIEYSGCIEDTIDYLDEFVKSCFSEEIYDGFEGRMIKFKTK